MRVLLWCLAFGACAGEVPQEEPVPVRPGATLDAEAHYDRGAALATQGRHTEAIDAYLQAAELAPNYVKIHYNLGNAYVRQLDYPRAIASYQRVLALDSTHVSARHNLAAWSPPLGSEMHHPTVCREALAMWTDRQCFRTTPSGCRAW